MIIVNVKSLDGNSVELTIKGHSESAPYGSDIICSAVSAVSVGALNALENPKDFNLEVKEGFVSVKSIRTFTKHDHIVLETMLVQLKSIALKNEKYIQVVEKGN